MVLCCPPGRHPQWTAAPWLTEQSNQWLDKDIRGMLIKFEDDTESLGRADVLNDRINTRHLLYSYNTLLEPGDERRWAKMGSAPEVQKINCTRTKLRSPGLTAVCVKWLGTGSGCVGCILVCTR